MKHMKNSQKNLKTNCSENPMTKRSEERILDELRHLCHYEDALNETCYDLKEYETEMAKVRARKAELWNEIKSRS